MSQPLIMSFRPDAAEMCLDGRKTMTRRIAKPDMGQESTGFEIRAIMSPRNDDVIDIWRVGESIAIKPKRTSKAIGRVMCTSLRVEHVQDITEEDARREGMTSYRGSGWQIEMGGWVHPTAREAFDHVWRRLNPRGPTSWDSNPLVVVIEFRPLKEGEK